MLIIYSSYSQLEYLKVTDFKSFNPLKIFRSSKNSFFLNDLFRKNVENNCYFRSLNKTHRTRAIYRGPM